MSKIGTGLGVIFMYLSMAFVLYIWLPIGFLVLFSLLFLAFILYADRLLMFEAHAYEKRDRKFQELDILVQHFSFLFGTKKPEIYYYRSQKYPLNAFAVKGFMGRGSIVVDKDLLETFSEEELKALVAYLVASLDKGDIFNRTVYSVISLFILSICRPLCRLENQLIRNSSSLPYTSGIVYLFFVSPLLRLFSYLLYYPQSILEADKMVTEANVSAHGLASALMKTHRLSTQRTLSNPIVEHLLFAGNFSNDPTFGLFRAIPTVEERYKQLLA